MAVQLRREEAAPEDYYQNNCVRLFSFVRQRHADLLLPADLDGLDAYLQASADEQRLFARLLTRKGPLFRLDSLNYREVGDLRGALERMHRCGLVTLSPADTLATGDQCLHLLRKAELVEVFAYVTKGMRSASKARLVECVLSTCSDQQIRTMVRRHVQWVRIAHLPTWQCALLLYFGDGSSDLSAFVMRDLGMVTFEAMSLDARRHATRAELTLELHLRWLSHLSYSLDEYPGTAVELALRLKSLTSPQQSASRWFARRRDKTLLRIAKWLESNQAPEAALAVYEGVQRHPARERMVRILTKLGEQERADMYKRDIAADPWSPQETQFLKRFGKRNGGYRPPTDVYEIDALEDSVEAQALNMLLDKGALWGAHVENSLVRTLTGLIYWHCIFAPIPGAFTNPFQSAPTDLYEDDFVAARMDLVAQVDLLSDQQLLAQLRDTATRKHGLANHLVSWSLVDELGLDNLLCAMPTRDIRVLTRHLIHHLPTHRSGLPDLFVVYGPDSYEFVEVKGPNDQLQPGQRVWLADFAELDVPARVLKLKLRSGE